jgi:A1 cistron-splicing factor AAR2
MDDSKNKNKDLNKINYEELKYDYNLRMTSGVLLLINCPAQMQFGIDSSKWKIGEKFMGIKLIPEGAHYVSYALSDEEFAIKQGFFIYVNNKKLIHIRKWDNDLEDFVSLKDEDDKNFSIGVYNLEFDPYLGNYPLEQYENWKDLSKYISTK